jgi:DivIVA domain-containing protein
VPLTPTDVANKQFRIAFRGYSLDEVDAFLDEVETELTRLLRERSAAPAATTEPAPVPVTVAEPRAAGGPAAPLTGMEGQESALRTLLLAQRTADAAIAEAQAEADELLTKARGEAERTLSEARAEASAAMQGARSEAETTVTGARAEAERTVTAARTEAHQTLTSARERAAKLEADVAAKVEAATGGLEVRRRQLEQRIEELRAFEREYRTRLKAYLETQLRELGAGHPSTPDETGVGVPADARAAPSAVAPSDAAPSRARPRSRPPGPSPPAVPPRSPRAAGCVSCGRPASRGPLLRRPGRSGARLGRRRRRRRTCGALALQWSGSSGPAVHRGGYPAPRRTHSPPEDRPVIVLSGVLTVVALVLLVMAGLRETTSTSTPPSPRGSPVSPWWPRWSTGAVTS